MARIPNIWINITVCKNMSKSCSVESIKCPSKCFNSIFNMFIGLWGRHCQFLRSLSVSFTAFTDNWGCGLKAYLPEITYSVFIELKHRLSLLIYLFATSIIFCEPVTDRLVNIRSSVKYNTLKDIHYWHKYHQKDGLIIINQILLRQIGKKTSR